MLAGSRKAPPTRPSGEQVGGQNDQGKTSEEYRPVTFVESQNPAFSPANPLSRCDVLLARDHDRGCSVRTTMANDVLVAFFKAGAWSGESGPLESVVPRLSPALRWEPLTLSGAASPAERLMLITLVEGQLRSTYV